ncbi:hypothetical protein QCA50_013185 [Cerrena zonata]|uniref:Uncharacterized protein n=1 Tax=Cerrena zonata TaxID=2478898 RepID=A0AAW0FXI4_9APHY
MQFNILTILATIAALGASAHGATLEARQSTCSPDSGCNCFIGSITLVGIPVTVDSCAITNPGTTCTPAGNPITLSVDGLASISLAIGACS